MNSFELSSRVVSAFIDGPLWLTIPVKMTILLLLAWLGHYALARSNPRWRLLLWRNVVLGLIAIVALDSLRFAPIPSMANVSKIASVQVERDRQIVPELQPPTSHLSEEFQTISTPKVSEMPASTSMPPVTFRTQTPTTQGFNWWKVFAWIWIAGIAVAFARRVIGRWRLNAVVQRSKPTSRQVHDQAIEIAKNMGVGRHVVLTSDEISSPLVCRSRLGWTLLLPKSTLDIANPDDVTAILAHELAHLAGRDLPWNTAIHAVSALLWPHPLTWRISAAHVTACEHAADAESARRLGDPSSYVRTLAKVALSANARTQLPGLAMTRVSKVQSRLERVMETFGQLPVTRRRNIAFALTALCACVALGGFHVTYADSPVTIEQESAQGETEVIERIVKSNDADDTSTEPKGSTEAGSMTIDVLDSSDAPVDNVTLNVIAHGDDSNDQSTEFEEISTGVFRVNIPQGTQHFSLRVSAPGQVPMAANWGPEDLTSGLPDEFTFRLPKGTKASGKVVDEADQPIADAKVYILVRTNQNLRPHHFYYDYFVTTDNNGRWASNEMPELLDEAWIRLEHPDFATDVMFGESVANASVDKLRAGTHVATMVKGVTVAGKVVDETGAPISNVTVFLGSSRFGSEYPKTQTNKDGKFSFEHCRPKAKVFTVVAQGFAPQLKNLAVSELSKPATIELKPPNTIRIRVVDPAGEPIGNARVVPDTWRDHRSLADVKIWRKTDADGLFEWQNAPADEIKYDVLAQGYMSSRDVVLKASDDVHVVTLNRPLVVEGSVTDSVTGKPIVDFKLIPGIHWESGQTTWDRRNLRKSTGGAFVYEFDYPRHGHLLQIEASGYEQSQSRVMKLNEGRLKLDFRLKPTGSLIGRVLGPDGKPAKDVRVVIAQPKQMNEIVNGAFRDWINRPSTVTDAEGRFTMPDEKDKVALLFLGESGVATMAGTDFQSGQDVSLKGWARIEGTVKVGGTLAKKTKVWCNQVSPAVNYLTPGFEFSGKATTDSTGKFKLAQVPPDMKVVVSRVVRDENNLTTTSTDGVYLNTAAGETHRIALGGSGRPVIGRIQVPDDLQDHRWTMFRISPVNFPVETPDGFNQWSTEKQYQWIADGRIKKPMTGFPEIDEPGYTATIAPDGTFRVDDVIAGDYELKLTINTPPNDKLTGQAKYLGNEIGSVFRFFTVPKMDGDRSDKPFDIGTIPAKLNAK